MSSPSIKLVGLRGVFVAYYVLKTIAGAIVAWSVFRTLAMEQLQGWRGWTPGGLAGFSLVVAAIVLVLAWLVFGQLLQRRNWARVLLLVIGWLAVLNAVFTLLTSAQLSEMGAWVTRLLPELDLDWGALMRFDRIQKIFELMYWGWLISVLQFDPAVRNEFFPAEAVEKKKEG
jgi:hypothetical protein